METEKERIYYVYVYLNPLKPGEFIFNDLKFKFEPFYVGKGKGKRMYVHYNEQFLKTDPNIHKVNTIKKILSEGKTPLVIKKFYNLTEEESFDIEKKLIEIIGRSDLKKGTLVNLTNGGDGCSGHVWQFGKKLTEETKNKISHTIKSQGKWKGDNNPSKTKDHKEYMSNLLKNRIYSNDTLEKMKLAKLGKKISDEHKESIRKSLLNRPCKDKTRSKISKSNSGKIRTSEMKMNCSLSKIENINEFILNMVFIKNNITMTTNNLIDKTKISRSVINRIKSGKHWSCFYSSEEFLNKLT